MNAYIKDGRVIFLPLPGAVPVAAADIIEEINGPLGADEEAGAIDSVALEPDGKVRIVREKKPKSKRTKAREDIDKVVEGHLTSLRAQVKTGGFAFKSAVLLLSLELRSEPLPEPLA